MCAETLLDIAMIHSDSTIEKARNGEEKAINSLVGLWYKRIYNYSYRYFLDHDTAMDMTQKTFISMYRNIAGLKDTARFKPWLYRIVANHCHDEDRRAKRGLTISFSRNTGEVEQFEKTADPGIGPDRRLQNDEMGEIVKEALKALSPEQREVVIMKEYEGLKFREIAETLEVSENTVKSRLYYGLNSLKKALKARSITKETTYYEG